MEDKIFEQIKEALPKVQRNVFLGKYTTYKIGGPAKYFFIARTEKNLITALKTAKKLKLPIFILGGGSNLLISDKGFKGLVIKADILCVKFKGPKGCPKVIVGAGERLTKLVHLSASRGLSGLEWSAGIPGAVVGGSIYGNAQAFGAKISDIVESVQVVDFKTLKLRNLTKKQCLFSLKNSIFKNPPAGGKNLVIVSAVLNFKQIESEKIMNQIKEFLDYRRHSHPTNFPSPGSTFINPEMEIKDPQLLRKFPELKKYNEKRVMPCGYLIAKCGLAGKKIGKAQISEKHANFIINLGGAKAKDVLALMELAQKKVKNVFGIELEPEIQMVGFK